MKYIIVLIMMIVVIFLQETYIFHKPVDLKLCEGLVFGVLGVAVYDFFHK